MNKIYLIFVLLIWCNVPVFGQSPGTPYFFNTAPVYSCGAFVAAGEYKIFMCYNLGATDTSSDPNVPIQGIHGNYYQWGNKYEAATASTEAGAISSWSPYAANNGAWVDYKKNNTDPCPVGFRVPTRAQWDGVLANNTMSVTGTWAISSTNFSSGVSYGANDGTKTLTLPTAGYRSHDDGRLRYRGGYGWYWSSTWNDQYNAWDFHFGINGGVTMSQWLVSGLSVRCVSQ